MDLEALDIALTEFLDTVTKAEPNTEARALRRMVKAALPQLQRDFLDVVAAVQDGISPLLVRRALAAGDIDAAMAAVPWDELATPVLRDQLLAGLQDVFARAGAHSTTAINGVEPFDFAIDQPWTSAFLETYGFELIQGVNDSTGAGLRESVRSVIAAMESQGLSVQTAADLLRPQIGLTERDAQTIENFRAGLVESGASEIDILSAVDSKTETLVQARALNIARTEGARMAMKGQRGAWEQAADEGLFDRGAAEREWVYDNNAVSADDPCPDLDGVVVGFDEQFPGGFDDPPDPHPGCGCTVILHPAGAN